MILDESRTAAAEVPPRGVVEVEREAEGGDVQFDTRRLGRVSDAVGEGDCGEFELLEFRCI